MSVIVKTGNIWNTKCSVLVNTVNCEGVMGAGIALEARLRYPEMYQAYKTHCQNGLLTIGKLWLYTKSKPYWILNFPTKTRWKLPSKIEYLESGLNKFCEIYEKKQIDSIAFPILGASHGGLSETLVIDIMTRFLDNLKINVEIYRYDPTASDDFFRDFKSYLLNTDINTLAKETKIRKQYLEILFNELSKNNNIYQVNQLKKIKGIGEVTLEKIFKFKQDENQQRSLAF